MPNFVINTTNEDLEVYIPPQQIEPFEEDDDSIDFRDFPYMKILLILIVIELKKLKAAYAWINCFQMRGKVPWK